MKKTPKNQERATVPELATRLEEVIRDRALVPGDRFLTTEEAARYLRVRSDLANRALQVLVHRGHIVRRQRVGATVADPAMAPPVLERVHVIVQENHSRQQSTFAPAAQAGLHSALVGCELEIHVLPSGGAQDVLEPLLRRSLRGGSPEGLVLVRCDYPAQRQARDSGLNAVVHGTTYAGIDLPSVDVDSAQMGELQAQSLVETGCDRLVVIRRDRTLPGDRAFMEGFRQAAARLDVGPGRITELEIAPYAELVRAELGLLFDSDQTLGIVCANEEFAMAAKTFATGRGKQPRKDFWIHVNDVRHPSRRAEFPYMEPQAGLEEQGAHLGRLLAERQSRPDPAGGAPETDGADGRTAPEQILVPCRLVYPA